MCVIMAIDDGNFPNYETLKSAEALNDDGASIAWLQDGKINYQKGIDAEKIESIISKILEPNKVKHAILHFRIASVGKVNKQLCHPFPISEKVSLTLEKQDSPHELLFHNGTISNWEEILIKSIQKDEINVPKGNLSDSRVMARLVKEYGHGFLKKVTGWNKFAILTKTGIKKYGDWCKVDGIKCSNNLFKDPVVFEYGSNVDYFLNESDFEPYFKSDEDRGILNELILECGLEEEEIHEYLRMGWSWNAILSYTATWQGYAK